MTEESKVGKPSLSKLDELSIDVRFEKLKKHYYYKTKKLLLIRPRIPGDGYTELGSYAWAADVKQKALDEGWQVRDLGVNEATRERIEQEMADFNQTLLMHYDHGSSFTLWGQENNGSEAGVDELNVGQASGSLISTVSCQSASGLGPAAIGEGVKSYIGYTENHVFVTNRIAEFGVASNAANFALLEGKTSQEAFDLGWLAYDNLVTQMLGIGDDFSAGWAMHDRDCLALLGDPAARGYRSFSAPHCRLGLPEFIVHCRLGLPDSSVLLCKKGMPHSIDICGNGPLLECAAGPRMGCSGGPFIEVPPELLEDIVTIDWNKVPVNMQKSVTAMLNKIKQEQ